MNISRITPNQINYRNNQNSINLNYNPQLFQQSFGAKPDVSKFFEPIEKLLKPVNDKLTEVSDKITDGIAKRFVKVLELEPTKWVIEKTVDNNYLRKTLTTHLSALTSVILSGFYISKTLKNDNLDADKKKTLAINQASVCALSTVLAYTFDNLANRKVTEVINKFNAINLFKIEDQSKFGMYKDGFRAGASLMIFGVIYRYISPVIVTPIANAIGNKLQEKKKAEQVASQK